MEARHCPPPGGWVVCGGGGSGGGGRGGWSELRPGSGKLPPPSRPLLPGVGLAQHPARLGCSCPGRPLAGAARRGLARPLALRPLRSRGPPGTPPRRCQHRQHQPGQAAGEGAAAGRAESWAARGGRTPLVAMDTALHPHSAQLTPSARGPGGHGAAWLARVYPGGRVPASEPGVPGAPAVPREAATSYPRAPLGTPCLPPCPHSTPQK